MTDGLGAGVTAIFDGAEGAVGATGCAGTAGAFATGSEGCFTAGTTADDCMGEGFGVWMAAGDAGSSGLPGAAGDGLAGGATTAFAGAGEAGGALSACTTEGFSAGDVPDLREAADTGAGLEAVPGFLAVGALLVDPAVGFAGVVGDLGLAGILAAEAAGLGVEVFFDAEVAAFFVDAGVPTGLGDMGRLAAVFAGVAAVFVPPDVVGFVACAAHASTKGTAAQNSATMPITQALRSALR